MSKSRPLVTDESGETSDCWCGVKDAWSSFEDLKAQLAEAEKRESKINEILRLGADEGPVYCDKPECKLAAIGKVMEKKP